MQDDTIFNYMAISSASYSVNVNAAHRTVTLRFVCHCIDRVYLQGIVV